MLVAMHIAAWNRAGADKKVFKSGGGRRRRKDALRTDREVRCDPTMDALSS